MGTVRFNAPEEFVRELKADRAQVDRALVRVTLLMTHSKQLPIRYLTVLATARVGQDIYRLERYCGELWGIGDVDGKSKEAADQVSRQLELELTALGLLVRSGELQEK